MLRARRHLPARTQYRPERVIMGMQMLLRKRNMLAVLCGFHDRRDDGYSSRSNPADNGVRERVAKKCEKTHNQE